MHIYEYCVANDMFVEEKKFRRPSIYRRRKMVAKTLRLSKGKKCVEGRIPSIRRKLLSHNEIWL